jgi:CRISPR-associated endonuclease/helicase Cas3
MGAAFHRRVLAQIWAKSPPQREVAGEGLVAHTAAVLSRLERLFDILPGLAERVGDERLWHRAALACILHDFGKLARGFQAQLRAQAKPWGHRHEVLSLAFIEWIVSEDPEGDQAWVAAAIASHHRDFKRIAQLYPAADERGGDPFDPVVELVREVPEPAVVALSEFIGVEVLHWLGGSRLPLFRVSPAIPKEPAADFRRNAVTRIYRALANYRRLFAELEQAGSTSPANLAALALRGIVLLADHTASAHVTQPLMPPHDPAEILKRLELSSDNLYNHQKHAARVDGNGLLTAPTGSGKTEAALLWSANQRSERPQTGRLFYVLPYQASINAMYDRLAKVFPNLVSLQHAHATQALYRRLLDNDRYDPESASKAARFQHSLAHLHFHPVRVLTPYQLLRSGFRLRGYESVIADAINGLFIFDEIHAYEPVRLGMILAMTGHLTRHLGARALFMSATFPKPLRKLLAETLVDSCPISADAEVYRCFARHLVQFLPGEIEDRSILEKVADLAAGRKAILVVCNTVSRSKHVRDKLATLLAPRGIQPELLHSRFHSRDRYAKERRLSKEMGTKARAAPCEAVVLVATQVVEVSLDIDFDVLFTEPAPLEALIQRFGRVNRGRKNPFCPVYVLTAPASGQGVYQDDLVGGALRVLDARDGAIADEAELGSFLDQIYTGEIQRRWTADVRRGHEEFTAACLNRLRAFQSEPELVDSFDRLFDAAEVLPQSLVDEYDGLMEEDPLRASELLVPISLRQLGRLQRCATISRHPAHRVLIAKVPYTSDGLEIERVGLMAP